MSDTTDKITEYLSNGGFWNPDLMDHEAVRDLLIQARDELDSLKKRNDNLLTVFRSIDPDRFTGPFISGVMGDKDQNGMPEYFTIVPAMGVDFHYVYENTGRTAGPEW